jgi:hypothetical protein
VVLIDFFPPHCPNNYHLTRYSLSIHLNLHLHNYYQKHYHNCIRFEVLYIVKIHSVDFCIISPCSLVGGYQCFGGTYCLLQYVEDGSGMFLRNTGTLSTRLQSVIIQKAKIWTLSLLSLEILKKSVSLMCLWLEAWAILTLTTEWYPSKYIKAFCNGRWKLWNYTILDYHGNKLFNVTILHKRKLCSWSQRSEQSSVSVPILCILIIFSYKYVKCS